MKFSQLIHSHKKGKVSLEGSLVRILFAAELEFPKIQVPRLLQNTSNVNTESTGRSKQLLFVLPTSWSPDIFSFYCSDINLFLTYCAWCKLCNKCRFSTSTTPGALRWRKNIIAVIT